MAESDYIGLKARVKVELDKGSVQTAKDSLKGALRIEPVKFSAGGVGDVGKFLQDFRTSMSGGGFSQGLGSAGGLQNIFGKGAEGMIGKLAGITIILDGLKDLTSTMVNRLAEASPLLRAQLDRMDRAVNTILRPMGDNIARMLSPIVRAMNERARENARMQREATEKWGPEGGLLFGLGKSLNDLQTGALGLFYEFSNLKPIIEGFRLGMEKLGNWANETFGPWANKTFGVPLEPTIKAEGIRRQLPTALGGPSYTSGTPATGGSVTNITNVYFQGSVTGDAQLKTIVQEAVNSQANNMRWS